MSRQRPGTVRGHQTAARYLFSSLPVFLLRCDWRWEEARAWRGRSQRRRRATCRPVAATLDLLLLKVDPRIREHPSAELMIRRLGGFHPTTFARGNDRSINYSSSSMIVSKARLPPADAPAELPQCMMGNRQVDDMSFMISCTNWY